MQYTHRIRDPLSYSAKMIKTLEIRGFVAHTSVRNTSYMRGIKLKTQLSTEIIRARIQLSPREMLGILRKHRTPSLITYKVCVNCRNS